jgi:ATP-dependent exoDNAse (exonuclease V) beta subunit
VAPPAGSPLSRPFEVLQELHRLRFQRPVSETFERLLQRTGAREVLAVRGFQSIANLHKLARTLRMLQQGKTFADVVDSLRMIDEEGISETESRVMEERSDAVRVMSIHKAKGLDFPIVIVAGMGLRRRNRSTCILTDVHDRKIFAVRLKTAGFGVQTPGWAQLSEEEGKREEQELIRLLYVALTRARDHLVLSTYHSGKGPMEGGLCAPDFSPTRLKPLAAFLTELSADPRGLVRILGGRDVDELRVSGPAAGDQETPVRSAPLLQEYSELKRMLTETPAGMELYAAGRRTEADAGPAEDGASASGAIRLGIAFHEVMENADLLNPAGAAGWAFHAGARHNLDSKSISILSDLIHTAMNSPLLERARRAARSGAGICRELPYVRPVAGSGSAIQEGKIDLLFEEDGAWVRAALRDLGIAVKEAHILLARTGDSFEM